MALLPEPEKILGYGSDQLVPVVSTIVGIPVKEIQRQISLARMYTPYASYAWYRDLYSLQRLREGLDDLSDRIRQTPLVQLGNVHFDLEIQKILRRLTHEERLPLFLGGDAKRTPRFRSRWVCLFPDRSRRKVYG